MLTGTSHRTALVVSRRIMEEVNAQRIINNRKKVNFTISIGIALFPEDGKTQKELFAGADRALYWAKQHGKDQICLAKDMGKKI
jgi:diguanylate cyclase (GGDEF)-like protein